MKVLQVVSEQTVSTDCQIIYKGIAFDGCHFYFTQPQSSKVYIYNTCMEQVDCVATLRGYSAICYDFQWECFWACSEKQCNKVYKLDRCFKEIGTLCVNTRGHIHGSIEGITCSNCSRNLTVAFSDGIMEVTKECGTEMKVLEECCGCGYTSVVACGDCYAYSYNKGFCQFLCVVYCMEAGPVRCCLEQGYKIEDMTIVITKEKYGCEDRGKKKEVCYLYVLASKSCCQSCIIKFKLDHTSSNHNCEPIYPHDCGGHNRRQDGRQSCTDIIESIALVEASISHILNAEGEKIQKAVQEADNICELLEVNESVRKTIINVTHLEQMLFSKLELVQEICPDVCKRC